MAVVFAESDGTFEDRSPCLVHSLLPCFRSPGISEPGDVSLVSVLVCLLLPLRADELGSVLLPLPALLFLARMFLIRVLCEVRLEIRSIGLSKVCCWQRCFLLARVRTRSVVAIASLRSLTSFAANQGVLNAGLRI